MEPQVSAGVSALLTIVGMSDAVLQDGMPLALLLLCHRAEVVMVSVGVPEDQWELGGTL